MCHAVERDRTGTELADFMTFVGSGKWPQDLYHHRPACHWPSRPRDSGPSVQGKKINWQWHWFQTQHTPIHARKTRCGKPPAYQGRVGVRHFLTDRRSPCSSSLLPCFPLHLAFSRDTSRVTSISCFILFLALIFLVIFRRNDRHEFANSTSNAVVEADHLDHRTDRRRSRFLRTSGFMTKVVAC